MNVALRPSARHSTFRTTFARGWSTPDAVAKCVRGVGATQPTLLIVFCGGKHAPHLVLKGFRNAYPTVPIVGGSAAGVISREGAGYSGLEIGAIAVFGSASAPAVVSVGGLDRDERLAGMKLGQQIATLAADDAVVFLFYDSVAANDPPRLHPAASIVSGIEAGLGGKRVQMLGGGMLTDLNLTDGWVFDGGAARKHAAVALVFPPSVAVETTITHGCRPASAFMTITRAGGAEVFELDDRPALEAIESITGLTVGGETGRNLSLVATLGQKLGDPYAPFDETAYVNRLILNADRSRGSITLFEPDFEVGARVQIMSRCNELMLASARKGVAEMNEIIASRRSQIAFSLYVDCAGRASARSGAPEEEADIVRRGLSRSVPILGFYSGVEIAPFGSHARSLDWSGVLATVRYRV